ncbi:diaminopimelate decarboxylase [Yinghuangia sp. YIM S09857]|uniref:diaminopimelate decarboxylase n=1 Tax=Yinghuangia sp. YIM S09857 TaxID=3436929 RepID=UPI003F53CFA7
MTGTGRRAVLDEAVRLAVRDGLLDSPAPVIGLLDVDGIRGTVARLHAAFESPAPVLHTFAAKACGLVPVLRLLAESGMGCEVASPGELAQALAAGFTPDRLVFDSPAKTVEELELAVDLGIAVNLDNWQELERLDAVLAARPGTGGTPRGPVGIRVNPQVGAGAIGAMSTATDTSKFGIALRDPGAEDSLVAAFARRPWLTRLHAHVGSQGCPLPLIAAGIRAAYELAERINAAVGRPQIDSLDIGGGLPVNFDGDDESPGHAAYVAQLREDVPDLFDGRYSLVTEFGRSVLAKHGMVLTRVEYTKSAGGRPIAITHAGAQVAARTVFMPQAWPLRVGVFDADGVPKSGPGVVQDVAGPCCFAGDLAAEARELPLMEPGDVVALYDTGAYYFSSHFAYNSLPRPAVHGFRLDADGRARFAIVREAQTLAEIVAESGDAYADSLVGLVDTTAAADRRADGDSQSPDRSSDPDSAEVSACAS